MLEGKTDRKIIEQEKLNWVGMGGQGRGGNKG